MRAFSILSSGLLIASSLLASRAAPSTQYDANEWIQYDKRAQTVPHFGNRSYKTVRGVNLGGWFVLEAWMNPSFFTSDLVAKGAVDQWTYMTAVGNNAKALKLLQKHWSTWINETDFIAIQAAGLNTVRIPVPHWTFNSSTTEPYLAGAELKYIQQAVSWAAKYKLDVLLVLHTAPGSQNGFDNSGHMGNATFESINPTKNAARMYSALQSIVNLFINTNTYSGAVKGIEILNEPACYILDTNYMLGIYQAAYTAIKATVKSTAPVNPTIVMHDCFIAPLSQIYNGFVNSSVFTQGTYSIDTHRYTAFSPIQEQLGSNNIAHIDYVCGMQPEISGANNNFPVIVGEWSLAVACSNCSFSTMSASVASQNTLVSNLFYRQFWEAQVTTYELGGGWIYWNWKTENAATWSYQTGLAQGWIPQNPTTRVFKTANGCPTSTLATNVTFATTSNSVTTSSGNSSTAPSNSAARKLVAIVKVAGSADNSTTVNYNNTGTTTGVLQKNIPKVVPFNSTTINSTAFPFISKTTFGQVLVNAHPTLLHKRSHQVSPRLGNGDKIVRGVNLGGWFILESWMMPYLFTSDLKAKGVVDQYTFMQHTDKKYSHSTLQKHWSTWIKETDFQQIAAAGLNTVRLPVPHWAFNGSSHEPYWAYAEQPFISQALLWAKQYNLDVIIDMHTAPNSQNGFDNSGRLGPIEFESKSPKHNVARLYSALTNIVQLYVNDAKYGGVVKGIEILNEPACWSLTQSYMDNIHHTAYDLIRKTVSSSASIIPTVIIHDCFIQPLTRWTNTYNRSSSSFSDGSYTIDTHRYQAFSPQNHDLKTPEQHIQYACGLQKELDTVQRNNFATIVGEWALGLVTTPIYDTMAESLASQNTLSKNLFYRRFYEAQVTSYEKAGGWIYWNWKTHSAAAWSYKAGLKQGWIPKDPTTRVFSQQNGCPTTTQIQSVKFATTSTS